MDLWHRDTLTGDWGGLRTVLADIGVTFTASYIGEVFTNVQGGMKRGTTYDGLFLPQIDVDLEKLAGWQGATFQVSMLEAHGQSIATRYVGNLTGISTIAAVPPSTRLYNFWLEQKLFGDALSIRAGLITVDEDFFNSTVAMVFMNPRLARARPSRRWTSLSPVDARSARAGESGDRRRLCAGGRVQRRSHRQ